MSDDVDRVFVYGTLMHGERNHPYYCGDALSIEPATTRGRLYELPGGLPAMVSSATETVHGEAMTFPDIDEALARLDVLEGYHANDPGSSLYLRRVRSVTLLDTGETVPAYCYVWRGLLPEGAARVPSGRWSCRPPR